MHKKLVFFNCGERRYIPQRFLTVEQIGNLFFAQSSLETFTKNFVFLPMKPLSKHIQVIDLTSQVEARD